MPKLKFENKLFCDACHKGKQVKASHKSKIVVSTSRPLQPLHKDLFETISTPSLGGKQYTLIVIDDYLKVFGYILNTKDHLRKLDSKSNEGIFLGYSQHSRANRVFNKRTLVVEESINVKFDESPPNSIHKPFSNEDENEVDEIYVA